MKTSDVFRAWGRILKGHTPALSLEVTRECPLRCPGCYAYDDAHLGGATTLRQLQDFKGQELIDRILRTVDEYRPLHLSLVGGDPLVRYREMEAVIPLLLERGIHVQLVTSAFRTIPPAWAQMKNLTVVVSIDGLAEEHDIRRAPATYNRILKHIAGGAITVHCTVTGPMMNRPGYLRDFMNFWSPRPEVKRVWFSIFTPQRGDSLIEILTPAQRRQVVEDLLVIKASDPKLDMAGAMIREFLTPPANPGDCIFSKTTRTISADFKTPITPCQFGGDPDCSNCGCVASAGLKALGDFKIAGVLPVRHIFRASFAAGSLFAPKDHQPRGTARPDVVTTIAPAPASTEKG